MLQFGVQSKCASTHEGFKGFNGVLPLPLLLPSRIHCYPSSPLVTRRNGIRNRWVQQCPAVARRGALHCRECYISGYMKRVETDTSFTQIVSMKRRRTRSSWRWASRTWGHTIDRNYLLIRVSNHVAYEDTDTVLLRYHMILKTLETDLPRILFLILHPLY